MPSSYSSRLRFELPASGEQSTTWGNTLNTFMGTLLEDAVAGVRAILMPDSDYTLTVANGAADDARFAQINLTGSLPTAARNVIVPSITKGYFIYNGTSWPMTVKTAAGTGVVVPSLATMRVWCDGTNAYAGSAPTSTSGGLIAPTFTGLTAINGSLATTGGASFGNTPTGITAVNAVASTSAFAVDMFGRAADHISIIRWLKNDGSTELARLQSGAGTNALALTLNGGTVGAWNVDTTGMNVSKYLTVGTGLTVTTGGFSVTGTSFHIGDMTTYRAGATNNGFIYYNAAKTAYMGWDGTNFVVAGGTIWHTGNLNPGAYAALNSTPTFAGTVYTSNGRFVAYSGGNPSLCVWDQTQAIAGGIMLGAANTFYLANMNGDGSYAGSWRWYIDGASNFVAGGNVSSNSDESLKTAIVDLSAEAAEDMVLDLSQAAAWFDWRDPRKPGRQLGFIAQRVRPVVPQAVNEGSDGILSVSDRPIVAALVRHLAALTERVRVLEAAHA